MDFNWQTVSGAFSHNAAANAIPSGWRLPKRWEILRGIEEESLTEHALYWTADDCGDGSNAWAIFTQNSMTRIISKAALLNCIAVQDAA